MATTHEDRLREVGPMPTKDQLRSIEWAGRGRVCPACKRPKGLIHAPGHDPDCWLAAALASPAPQPADGDGSVMVRIDRVYVDAMRGDGLTGPFACVRLVEHEGEPRLELTTAPVPTPDTADWWREVAQGLGVEIAKMKALVSAPACVATTPQGDVCGLCGRPSADHRGPENAAAPAPAKAATDDAAYRAMRARVIAEQDARARELEGR